MPIVPNGNPEDGPYLARWRGEFQAEETSIVIAIQADKSGLWIGSDYIAWEDLDNARSNFTADK